MAVITRAGFEDHEGATAATEFQVLRRTAIVALVVGIRDGFAAVL